MGITDCKASQPVPGFDRRATNLCKGIAICIMVYFHCFGATDENTFVKVIPLIYNILGPYGNVCVPFFVLFSGYGFAAAYFQHSRPVSVQLRHRILGLYQSYWPAFLTVFLLTPLNRITWSLSSCAYAGGTVIQFVERMLLNFLGLSHYAFGDGIYTLCQTWWYMSLALILIFVLPVLCTLWERLGIWGMLPVIAAAILLPDLRYLAYFPAAMLGVCLNGSNGFSLLRKKSSLKGKKLWSVLLNLAFLFFALLAWYRMRQHEIYPVLANTLAAFAASQFAFDVLYDLPLVNRMLEFLGRHSGNIFYIHSFLLSESNHTGSLIFRLRYDLLIFLAVLVLSLMFSLLIEWVKQVSGWNRLFRWLDSTRSAAPAPAEP